MLVSEIIARVRRAFGDTNSVEITDADIIRWINDAMREIVPQAELLQAKATTLPLNGTPNYALPDDMLKVHSIKYAGRTLEYVSLEQAEELFPNKDNPTSYEVGTPTHCWIWGNELYLYPAPNNTTDAITCYYNRMPLDVTATGDTPELPTVYHNRIVEYCMAQAYELDQDAGNAQNKLNQFQNNLQSMRSLSTWEEQEVYPFITDLGDRPYASY